MKFKKNKYVKKFNITSLSIFVIFSFLIAYSFYLQILSNGDYKKEVNISVIKQRKIPSPRGLIYDRNGVILANNSIQHDLYLLPYYFKDDIQLICSLTKINCDLLKRKIKLYPRHRILVTQNIDDYLVNNLEHIPGLFIYTYSKRIYNLDTATSHIVGYVGRITQNILDTENYDNIYASDDIVGQSGLEHIYDKELHGLNGAEQYVVMANGLELLSPNRFLNFDKVFIQPVKGNNLILSIDDRIQLAFANAIGSKKGTAVMLDVNSGAVLAMYSSPSFDPNNITQSFSDPNHPLINKAIAAYAPGSTFKLVTALAALELGVIDEDDTFNCSGYYEFGNRTYHCWEHKGHGKVALRDAIKKSCDIYFYNLAQKVGLDNIVRYASMLGFNQFTGIDLDNENKGMLVKNKTYKGAILNTVIGQGEVLVSPLQLANAYATIVNGGKLYSPKLVMGQTSLIRDNHFNMTNIEFLKDALYGVINEEEGTAYYSRVNDLVIAGKTGTAQKAGLDKKNIKDNGWFVGFYPVQKPEIVVAVFIQDGEHGSSVAPIAFKAIQEYSKDYASHDY